MYCRTTGRSQYKGDKFQRSRYQCNWKVPLNVRETLNKIYNQEFIEVTYTKNQRKIETLQEDREILQILDGAKMKDGNYLMLGKRLSYLIKKFIKNEK